MKELQEDVEQIRHKVIDGTRVKYSHHFRDVTIYEDSFRTFYIVVDNKVMAEFKEYSQGIDESFFHEKVGFCVDNVKEKYE